MEIINNIKKTKKIILAISAAATAIPVNPNTPAMTDTIKNVKTQNNKAISVPVRYMINEAIKRIKKTMKMIFAISAETIAIPVKPNIAATMAIIRKISTHPNIEISSPLNIKH